MISSWLLLNALAFENNQIFTSCKTYPVPRIFLFILFVKSFIDSYLQLALKAIFSCIHLKNAIYKSLCLIFDAIKLRFSVERFSIQILLLQFGVENFAMSIERWKSLSNFNLVSPSVSKLVFQLKLLVIDAYAMSL